ncbi:MAG: DUF342 domain-containing protein [Desulfobacter sp.]|nr:DUF342 domain-containing protein [Desulfobacter sp.]WDP83951.1 MAG: DUF342 domain-containing protein [Desulfobacter sp.]
MIKTEEFDPNLTLFDLKEIFDDNGIIFGLVDDNALENFIKSGNTQTRFELAKGLPPVQGTDARIFYLFDQNYLSAGLLGKDGSMDFKDRGEIPSVLKGDVLAEKIPCISGRDGINVFGDTVTADPPRDMDILCGDGVGFSQDKLTAHALIDGYPMLNRDGVITVTDAHVIRGDVDYNTGHVKFDKSVFITGTIKSGFRVEAKDVVVRSVDGGTIISQGDVSVANDITDATIRTRGGISAGFVHRSRLSCMGDMDIEKEVVESTLVLEGTFEMSQGKLFASSVSARGGAKIYHVGSIKTLPSTIAVGISPYMQKEMNFLNRQIEKNQGNYDNQSREKINLENQLAEIEQKLARLNTAGKNKEQPLLDPERHNQKIAEFRRKKNRLERETAKAEKELTILSETVKHWISEKFNLQRQSYASPPKPILDVKGRIFTDTKVKGIHSSTVITQDLTRVRLIEMSCANKTDDRRKAWEMITTRL